jgi:hypothetical protein
MLSLFNVVPKLMSNNENSVWLTHMYFVNGIFVNNLFIIWTITQLNDYLLISHKKLYYFD